MTPYEMARAQFNSYAGMDAPKLPESPMSSLQVELCRWATNKIGVPESTNMVLGMVEELGELAEALVGLLTMTGRLAHVMLKSRQKIRGFDDPEKVRVEAADAIADLSVFAVQLCTTLRLDYGTLLFETAENVMQRDWTKNRQDGAV